jgi:hypothetical protein
MVYPSGTASFNSVLVSDKVGRDFGIGCRLAVLRYRFRAPRKYTKITPTHHQKTDSETAFKNLNQGGKVLSPNYVFHNLFHAISGR